MFPSDIHSVLIVSDFNDWVESVLIWYNSYFKNYIIILLYILL